MKKNTNWWKIVWIVGIYAILITILYLVVLYKVKWEHKDLNTYLYFYDCNRSLCTSTVSQDEYYTKVKCDDKLCPYITSVIDDSVILKNGNKTWIYNYIDGINIGEVYKDYKYVNNGTFIFTDNNNKQGVLTLTDGVVVQSKYDYIDNYKNGLISYKTEILFGIDSLDGNKTIEPMYQDIILINDELFAGKKENNYNLYSFDNTVANDENKYNYIYAYDNIIFVFANNKIDILNDDFDSLLLMKINTFYDYAEEQERDTLKFYFDGENILFDVFVSEDEYTTYKFSLTQKKLI